MKNRSLLWYRLDLRIHDNEALYEAIRWNNEVIPVYVFDPRLFSSKSRYGHARCHPARAQFLIESIAALRDSWRAMGSDLIVRIGHPEQIIFDLAKEFKTSMVFCNRERTRDEVEVQDKLEQNLWTIGQEMRFTRGKMLYYTQDLPFPVTHTPDNFTTFRKELERIVPIRTELPMPDSISPIIQAFDPGAIPTMKQLGYRKTENDHHFHFLGGEQEGIKRLKEYIWAGDGLKKYKSKDSTIADPLYSSKLSPWLSMGCLSPKAVYHEIKSYESIQGSTESTQSLITELIRRDYCRLIAKKYGNKIFQRSGVTQKIMDTNAEEKYLFRLWKEGRLGIPLIDAAMKALAHTGYLAYPLRNACAHFLIYSLKVNWQRGADWYEANLIDYDPASNWVNWMTLAGLLPDAMEEKPVSINFLNKKYDPQGNYIKAWIPALNKIPESKIFHPEALSDDEMKLYDLVPGKQYPKPVILGG